MAGGHITDHEARPLLGSRAFHLAAIFHQITYALPPVILYFYGFTMDPALYGHGIPGQSTNVWFPFFILTHTLAAVMIIYNSHLSATVALICATVGYFALANFSVDAPLGELVRVWSVTPNMVQNGALAVVLMCEAVDRRDFSI